MNIFRLSALILIISCSIIHDCSAAPSQQSDDCLLDVMARITDGTHCSVRGSLEVGLGQDTVRDLVALATWDKPLLEQDKVALQRFITKWKPYNCFYTYVAENLLTNQDKPAKLKPDVLKALTIMTTIPPQKIVLRQSGVSLKRDGEGFRTQQQCQQLSKLSDDIVPLLKYLVEHIPSDSSARRDLSYLAIHTLSNMKCKDAGEYLYSIACGSSILRYVAFEAMLDHRDKDMLLTRFTSTLTTGSHFTYLISTLYDSRVSDDAKFGFLIKCYELSDDSTKMSVISTMRMINTKRSFLWLRPIADNKNYRLSEIAFDSIAALDTSDTKDYLLQQLKDNERVSFEWIIKHRVVEAVPYLKACIEDYMKVSYNSSKATMAAAALARLGIDYKKNVLFVRNQLRSDNVGSMEFRAAGWVCDDGVATTLRAILESPQRVTPAPNPLDIIDALANNASPAALSALEDAFSYPCNREYLHYATKTAEALQRAAKKAHSKKYEAVARQLKAFIAYIEYDFYYWDNHLNDPEAQQILPIAAAYLRAHPQAIPNLFRTGEFANSLAARLQLIRAAWTPAATEHIEAVIEANRHPVVAFDNHQTICSELAKLLTEKTGTPYTCVDVDSTTEDGGE